MATLYNLRDSNVNKTWALIFIFFILIIFLAWIFSYIFNKQWILWFAVIFAVVQSLASYWFSDKIVVAMTGAKPLEKRENQYVYNLVENLCIANGMPNPQIYILEEPQINAFATGRDERHALIAITRGALEKLEKKELEGVIAHELSHIKNKDILLASAVVVLVGIVATLTDIFFRISISGNRRSEKGNGLIVLGIVAMIFMPIIAKIIQLAISRKREFLADASAGLLTRYPEGLARALEKIKTDSNPMKTAGTSTAHLFISSPFKQEKKQWFVRLFSTHPPLDERIKALREIQI